MTSDKIIEKVVIGTEVGTDDGALGKQSITVIRRDGSERRIVCEGRCFTFINSGFLVEAGDGWCFYDAACELVSTRTKEEVGVCTDVTLDYYSFEKDGVGDQLVDSVGCVQEMSPGGRSYFRPQDVFAQTTTELERLLQGC